MDKKLSMNDIDKMWTGTSKKYTIKRDGDDVEKCKFTVICNSYQKNDKTCNSKQSEDCKKYNDIDRLIS